MGIGSWVDWNVLSIYVSSNSRRLPPTPPSDRNPCNSHAHGAAPARWQPRERKGKVVPITIANSLALAVTLSASASWFGYWLALIASRAPEENQPRRRSDARVPRRCRKLLLGACANKSSFGSRSSLVTFPSRDNHGEDSRSLWWKNTGGGWKFACDNCRFQRKGRVVNRAV